MRRAKMLQELFLVFQTLILMCLDPGKKSCLRANLVIKIIVTNETRLLTFVLNNNFKYGLNGFRNRLRPLSYVIPKTWFAPFVKEFWQP